MELFSLWMTASQHTLLLATHVHPQLSGTKLTAIVIRPIERVVVYSSGGNARQRLAFQYTKLALLWPTTRSVSPRSICSSYCFTGSGWYSDTRGSNDTSIARTTLDRGISITWSSRLTHLLGSSCPMYIYIYQAICVKHAIKIDWHHSLEKKTWNWICVRKRPIRQSSSQHHSDGGWGGWHDDDACAVEYYLYIRCDRESKEIENENDIMQKYV